MHVVAPFVLVSGPPTVVPPRTQTTGREQEKRDEDRYQHIGAARGQIEQRSEDYQ
jgi:hypothetical protein